MAAPKKVKLPRIISPAAALAYAWLDKPDTKFSAEDAGKYKGTLLLDEDSPETRAYIAKIAELGKGVAAEKGVKLKKNFKIVKDALEPGDDGYKEEWAGKVRIEFKTNFQPACFDSAGNTIPASDIRSGDVVRIAGLVDAYEAFGSGISMKLFQVQLIEKRNAGPGQSVFDQYEGGYVADEASRSSFDGDGDGAASGDDTTPNDGAGF